MTGLDLAQRGVVDVAESVLGRRAARVKVAAGRRRGGAGHVAGQHHRAPPFLDHGVGDRHRRKQRLGVGVQGLAVELVVDGELDDATQVHHGDPVGDVAHDREIVGDEQVGQAELPLELLQQVDDLRADRHVEGADGLVADDEVGLDRERPGDADALALAARELVRVAVDGVGVDADQVEQLLDPALALVARAQLVDEQRLAHDVAQRHAAVERGVGVLKDHLHAAPLAAQRAAAAGSPGRRPRRARARR